MFYCLNIFDFLKAGPQKQFSSKPVRCAKKVADHCFRVFSDLYLRSLKYVVVFTDISDYICVNLIELFLHLFKSTKGEKMKISLLIVAIFTFAST